MIQHTPPPAYPSPLRPLPPNPPVRPLSPSSLRPRPIAVVIAEINAFVHEAAALGVEPRAQTEALGKAAVRAVPQGGRPRHRRRDGILAGGGRGVLRL